MFDFFKKKQSPAELFFHTDIHCHLVPGIDDGQKEAEGASALVEREKQWGVTRIITTPHVTQDTFENTPEIIEAAFAKLQKAVNDRGTEIELMHSAEYRLDGFFQEQLKEGNITPMPGNHILVENPFIQEAWDFDNVLFNLQIAGYKPILAHPERYPYYFSKPQRYEQIHHTGVMFQVNLLSLAGYYGKEVKRIAEHLLDKDLIDFIGTDMHNVNHCQAIDGYIRTKDYRRHADKLKGRILNDSLLGVGN